MSGLLRSSRSRALRAIFWISAGWCAASAQERPAVQVLSAEPSAEGVRVQAKVSEPGGRSITGLGADRFTARWDGQDAAIARVRPVAAGGALSVVLVLDVSGSMKGAAMEGAIGGARTFASQLGQDDYAALVTCGSGARVAVKLQRDRQDLNLALGRLTASDSQTVLYQAVFEAIEVAAAAPTSRAAVVLLTDGRDAGSAISQQDLMTKATVARIPVWTLAYGANADAAFLRRLATVTRGGFLQAPTPEALSGAYSAILDELKNEYELLVRRPAQATAGARLEIQVSYRGQTASGSIPLSASVGAATEAAPAPPAAGLSWLWIAVAVAAAGAAAVGIFLGLRKRRGASELGETIVVPRVWLEVVRGADTGKKFLLFDKEMIIAREPGMGQAALALDPMVGRHRHARLYLNDRGQYVIEDLNSKNGVTLNDQRLTGPAALQAGDRIGVGLSELLFIDQR